MSMKRKTTGNALLVAIVLLLLVSLMGLFALNVGMFEQRASGNDVRAKLVNEVAEAGLAQGMEYLKQNSGLLQNPASSGSWQRCAADAADFPCGSVPRDAQVRDASGAAITVARRSTMYYWQGGGHDFDESGAISGWEARMLPIGNTLGNVNSFPTRYGVGAVLCRVAFKVNASDPTVCTDDPSQMSPSSVVTLVSVGSLPTEGSRATLTQTIGTYSILNNPPGKPPIIASGSVDVTGTLQIVTNPNAGGAGVPVSVWTRKDMVKFGTPNTCYADEFFRFGGGTTAIEGASKVVTCDDCDCQPEHTLSYQSSGNLQLEGIDILDVDTDVGINRDVKPNEFPCDLFEQVFAVKAWRDTNGDHFCETKIMTTYRNPNNGVSVEMGADEAFLYANAKWIIPRDTAAAALRMPSQVPTLAYPSANWSGLVWCQTSCSIEASGTLGSPDKPVLLVVDGAATIKGRIFGMVFLRSTGTSLDPETGGTATLTMNGKAAIYGSVVVQGKIDKASGTAAVIYNGTVLANLANDPSNNKFGGLPGGWADDRISY